MRSIFVDRFRALVTRWQEEAAARRARTPSDPAAETLDSCGRDVGVTLADVERDTRTLTPTQYGEAHGGLTPQTITRWIRAGELMAECTPNGYRISRDAVRIIKIDKLTTGNTNDAIGRTG